MLSNHLLLCIIFKSRILKLVFTFTRTKQTKILCYVRIFHLNCGYFKNEIKKSQYLNHLRFADGIAIMTPDLEQLQLMLTQSNGKSRKVELKMSQSKTQYMANIETDRSLTMKNGKIERDYCSNM